MIYEIFGKKIRVEYEDDNIRQVLAPWLENYNILNESKDIDVDINFVNEIDISNKQFYNSPSDYFIFNNGVFINKGLHKLYFEKKYNNKLLIKIKYNYTKNFIKMYKQKISNIGYHSTLENVGAFFHEMVLVYMQHLFYDRALIHSSAMKSNKSNKIYLFGGSGGVGKTSLELLLCNKLEYSFIADDISVIDEEGCVYPNLAYPKIYAYNVENNEQLKRKIFENRDFLDKFQWFFKIYKRGPKSVRRAINPNILYGKIERNKNKIDKYFILQKTNMVTEITIEKIDYQIASKATLNIIQNEYAYETIHFKWAEYGTMFENSITPIVELNKVYDEWHKIYNNIFENIETYVIKLPINLSHNKFLEFFTNYFKDK